MAGLPLLRILRAKDVHSRSRHSYILYSMTRPTSAVFVERKK